MVSASIRRSQFRFFRSAPADVVMPAKLARIRSPSVGFRCPVRHEAIVTATLRGPKPHCLASRSPMAPRVRGARAAGLAH